MVVGIIAATRALSARPEEARRAMDQLRELDSSLRISNLKDWLPIDRPVHLSIFADGLRKAGASRVTSRCLLNVKVSHSG